MKQHILLAVTTSLLLLLPTASPLQAADHTAAELLPATTVAYAELTHPDELLSLVLDHPLRAQLESLDDYQQALQEEGAQRLKQVVALLEGQLGMSCREALGKAAADGIYVGLDAQTQGAVLLVAAGDETTQKQILEVLLQLARAEARKQGQEEAIKQQKYRGIAAYSVGEARLSIFGRWLVVTNKADLGKAVLDQYLDGDGATLAENSRFQTARRGITGKPTAWAYADLATLRAAGVAKELFSGKIDNPLGELLIGGIAGALPHADFATGSLTLTAERAQLSLAIPFQADQIAEARQHYFGPGASGTAPPLLVAPQMLFAASTYRNVSQMWLFAPDLFSDNTNARFDQADSNLSTLFSGRDFGRDILGAFEPQIQFVATRQQFSDEAPTPAIKLPAFAAVFELREQAKMQPELRRIYQSLIGFLNIIGTMQGNPQLDMSMDTTDTTQLISASFLPEEGRDQPTDARIHFNFSPSVAFAERRFILASTKQLAQQLMEQPATADAPSEDTNTTARANFASVAQALRDNREQLIAQNMLSEGHGRAEAEKQIHLLLSLVDVFRHARLQLTTPEDRLQLDFEIVLQP